MKKNSNFLLKTLAVFMLLVVPVAGFTQETTSSIRGRIIDEVGVPVAGATVAVEDLRTGATRTYTSNSTGAFFASRLPVGGPYRVTITGAEPVIVDRISLGDIYNLTITMAGQAEVEEIIVTATQSQMVDVAAGPAATFSAVDMDNAVAFDRNITGVFAIDPRINLDVDGFSVNCAGQHPRFNNITMDGVSQNDRFGLNSNGYSTATGMPFPFNGIEQVAVELAPFDVTYGGFSACNINVVSRRGTNDWHVGAHYEYTSDSLRGDSIGGFTDDFGTSGYSEQWMGLRFGGPIIQDKLFVFAAYEQTEEPRFLAHGYAGSGSGSERPWLSQADYDRIVAIAQDPNIYGYDPGGLPGDGVQENETYMARLDWHINENHEASIIYNYFDGFQDRASDSDSNEFEFPNHFYQKGSISETTTLKFISQWTDAFSTEIFYSKNTMEDSQVTKGPQDFADMQISVGGRTGTVYLGADDSRQANALDTESEYIKLSGQFYAGNHLITAGYERDELTIFNKFVQHSRGGEYDFFDDSTTNDPGCHAPGVTALDRLNDTPGLGCELSGIDRFELGRPSRIYYGSGGGTNDPNDAAANFSNTLHAFYIQDEIFFDAQDLTIVAGIRYETFESDDRPNFNQAFTTANSFRNDQNIDGVDLVMPRLGFTWGIRDDLTLRGGVGLFSGGNPNVWISNAWSNDGLTNVQLRLNNFGASRTVLQGLPDSIDLIGAGRPGYDIPEELYDAVDAVTPANAVNEALVVIDPSYKQPKQWKYALGATYDLPWFDNAAVDIDLMHMRLKDAAFYVDLSQDVIGTTTAGQPIYDYVNGEDNFMLTNSSHTATMTNFAISLSQSFDWGLDLRLGYAYTDSEDISPMTSSVAASNYNNTALFDVNDPRPGTSNYLVPHRFTFRAYYGTELFGDLRTGFTLKGYHQEGQPQSYVMGSSDLEGDGFFGRHLLYVPTGPGDSNVEFDPAFDQQAFFDFVAREGLSPGFQSRNNQQARWSTRWDVRLDQELPGFMDEMRGRLYVKIYNVGNLLNDDWGRQWDAQFFSIQVVDSSLNASDQYVFEEFNDRALNDIRENRSLWEARIGLEFNFN